MSDMRNKYFGQHFGYPMLTPLDCIASTVESDLKFKCTSSLTLAAHYCTDSSQMPVYTKHSTHSFQLPKYLIARS
ncbi:hypothetical protein KL905_003118 [Ogataea polymorpha]|nr:hypothetical protein KL937_003246 [Ogataea polymorpha]KAG7902802.1 hypothetical protein KL907_003935 [Ogataea polymorpha]KAG7920484.1 hypothetical protein KL905_003118 [Ogataea polymorpha]KAG7926546.1 hypothetical protein KL925_003596 [Ogataea polymorpha]KAG7935093.1 hypothetical protein KL904_003425 [Ogataea polymorpha]